jgi:hypothetical protein
LAAHRIAAPPDNPILQRLEATMDRPLTLRFPQPERAEIDQMAAAAGCSSAELIRRHWRQRGSVSLPEMNETLAGIGAVVVQLYERFEALEQRPAEPSAVPNLTPIEQRIERVERALNSLISAVERLYQTRTAAAHSPGVSAGDSATASELPPGKKPAPPNGFWGWIEQQPYLGDDETKPQRSKRLIPVYNAQFHPEFKPGGA